MIETPHHSITKKIIIAIIIILSAGTGVYFFFHRTTQYQFVTVKRGPITESVSVTGNTTPLQSVSLTFSEGGIISNTYSDIGKKVNAGEILAKLDTSDLVASVNEAKANFGVQQAQLAGLEAGSRPEDIAASQAALNKAKQDLANMYSGISDASVDGYNKANDAVRTQLNPFFSNGESQNPTLSYFQAGYVLSQDQVNAEDWRVSAGTALNLWQEQLNNNLSNSALETLLQNEVSYLSTIQQFLNFVSKTLYNANNLPSLNSTTLAAYQASLSVALNEVSLAAKNLNTISQNIASQKQTVSELQAELDLKRAGASASDIAAQEAQVAQAQASVESAQAKLDNAQIIAPISGTITQFDAKVGQLASPATPLISIISNTGYEVDAGVSEIDVGKIAVGDTVTMTLDAFPNETFNGSVFYIAPGETNANGVITYLTKISFAKPDSRLKSGLTANINIQTEHKDGALLLSQYAILQSDTGTFVETLENNKITQVPVTLGIQDQEGNVEVLSGVTEGEQVLNIGLKAQ